MDFGTSDRGGTPDRTPLPPTAAEGIKILITGGFAVGKTAMVRSVSEIRPLSTEETMTAAGSGVDSLAGTPEKTTTTVAFDFGRITLNERMVLYLFGAPGQERFAYIWQQLFVGCLGAVVLVDERRLEDSWFAIDQLERDEIPFLVARNNFGAPRHTLERLRDALDLADSVQLLECDARDRESSKAVLIRLVEYLHSLSVAREVGE